MQNANDELMQRLRTPAVEKRSQAIKEAEQRAQEVEAKFPDIAEKKSELKKLPLNVFRQQLSKKEADQKREELRKELRELLDKHNIPEDYDQPDYYCEICNDTGRVDLKMCQCEERRIRHLKALKVFGSSGVPKKKRKETFDYFDFKYYSKNQTVDKTDRSQEEQAKLIYKKLEKFCDDVGAGNEAKNFYIHGDVGAGKSCLTFAVANRLINDGVPFLYRRYDRLILEIQQTYSQKDKPTIEVLQPIFNIEVLILDDLGVEIPSNDSALKLYQMLEERASANKPTIITSNFSLGQIGSRYNEKIMGKRITRRVAELCDYIYKLEAKGDITLLNKQEGEVITERSEICV